MHRHTIKILYFGNAFQSTNITIEELVYINPPNAYLERLKNGPLCPKLMTGIQGNKPVGNQWNMVLAVVVKII